MSKINKIYRYNYHGIDVSIQQIIETRYTVVRRCTIMCDRTFFYGVYPVIITNLTVMCAHTRVS